MNMKIVPFRYGHEYSLELGEFWPRGGYAKFLKDFCTKIGGGFLDWSQGVESGIGHINFENQKLTVYWSDFPDAFSFDCNNQSQAERLKLLVEKFLVHKLKENGCVDDEA